MVNEALSKYVYYFWKMMVGKKDRLSRINFYSNEDKLSNYYSLFLSTNSNAGGCGGARGGEAM